MSASKPHPIHPMAEKLARPFLDELAARFSGRVRAIYLTGSAVTPDFRERNSDINTLLVLRELSFDFLDEIAQMGKKYGKRRIRAPLLLTLEETRLYTDAFPVEILDLKLVSHLIQGEDVLSDLQVDRGPMRLQCERELRGRVVRLRQEFVHVLGDPKLLERAMVASVSGLIALLRGALYALGRETPLDRAGVLAALRDASGKDMTPVEAVFGLKIMAAGSKGVTRGRIRFQGEKNRFLFKEYCAAMAGLAETLHAPV